MTNKKAMSIVKAAFKKVYKGVFTKDELDGIFYTGKNDPGEWATISRVVVHAESVGLSYEDYGYDEFCEEVGSRSKGDLFVEAICYGVWAVYDAY